MKMENKLHTLSQIEVDNYKKNGYHLLHKQLLDANNLEALTQIFEEHLAEKGAKLSDELDTPHFRDPRLLKFLLHKDVLELVQDIIGPNIGLFSSHFISKDPHVGRRTPWHEDSSYWKGKFDSFDGIVTIWLAIDDSNLANGCLGVIPGTHINGFSEYEGVDTQSNTFSTEIVKGSFDESKVVWFEIKRGECSLHDARIIHGANANTSSTRRCGYTMRYFNLNKKFTGDPQHLLWHARGENIAGNKLEMF